jgi:hypothetical protein
MKIFYKLNKDLYFYKIIKILNLTKLIKSQKVVLN